MLRVALKTLLGHKLRTLFTAAAVALGVAFMAGTFVLTDTVSSSFDTIFTDAYAGIDAQVRGRTAFEADAFDGGSQRPDIDPALVDVVRSVDGVAEAEPVVSSFASVLEDDGTPLSSTGTPTIGANWTGVPAIDVFRIVEGEAPEGPTEVVVDSVTADAGGYEVGDTIGIQTLSGAVDLDLVGIVRFGDSGNLGGASFALMETQAAIDTFGFDGNIQGIAAIAEDGIGQDELVERIAAALPPTAEVISGADLTEEATDQIGAFVDTIRLALSIFALIALAAGAFLIYNTFGIVIGQRTRELALLRALGSARSQVLSSVVLEALVIGLVASVLGLLGGIVLAVGLQNLLATTGLGQAGVAPVVSPRTIVVALLVGTVVSVLCAVVPAWRASRVAPLAALREVAVEGGRRSPVRLAIGAVLAVAGGAAMVSGAVGTGNGALLRAGLGTVVLFAGVVALGPLLVPLLAQALGLPFRLLGVPGALGRDNARRNPKRSAGTAAALMLSVTLISLIAVFTQSFGRSINAALDEDFHGDLQVIGGGFGFPSLGPDLVDGLAERPEVGAVTGVQRGVVAVDDGTTPVYAVRFSDVEQIYDLGGTEGDIASLTPDQVAIARTVADDEGLALGDTVTMVLPDGVVLVMPIGAIFEDAGIVAQNSDGNFLVDAQVFRDHFPGTGQLVQRIEVKAAEGVTVEELRTVVEDEIVDFPAAEVRDVGEIKDENNRQLQFSLAIFFALLGLALVIGALGIAITLALSVFERTREVGLLRAVGTTRTQLAGSITVEAIILTLLGTVLGLAIGTAGGAAMMLAQSDQFDTLRIYVSPLFILGVLALAVVIGVAASLIPGWRAARMDVLRAVTVE